ncbi:MAG: adenosylmethionine--8-amino-7-oxononanoate transaminase [Actinobacteria bacterium]|nr:adenosylmethionine--8-amino-7-oxononanoate transaminase [Actinomycetota bacterium]
MTDPFEISSLEHDDKRYIWHPFTQMKDWLARKPIIIAEGFGSYLKDVEGNVYLDGVSSLWVTVHGHRRKEIDQAIIAQIGQISHSTMLGLSNVPAIRLARRLVQIAPAGLTRVFYSDSGSTAVEIALKMAFQYWQQCPDPRPRKNRFISFKNAAYHGDTIGSVSVGGIDLFHATYRPLLFPTFQVEAPYCYRCFKGLSHPRCEMACIEDLEATLGEHHEEVAGLIIEPLVQAAAGMLVAPPGYLSRVRDLCSKYDVLMIADEVAVGFGRTGRMFACEHEDVHPDLMTVAKGITGGYLPLAATLVTERIHNAFLGDVDEKKTFYHGHTYTGNPLACAAANANLDVFENDRTLETLQVKIDRLRASLQRFSDLEHVGDVRQCGFMVGIELVHDGASRTAYPTVENVGVKVILQAREMGLIIRPLGDVIVIMPPLSVSDEELDRIIDIVYESVQRVTG